MEIVKKNTNNAKSEYINCIVSDIKAHSYNKYPDPNNKQRESSTIVDYAYFNNLESGKIQTGIKYPKSHNEAVVKEGSAGGSIIEFCTDNPPTDIDLSLYDIVSITSNLSDKAHLDRKTVYSDNGKDGTTRLFY